MNKKQNKGITLVALVITIIVLIILAGVSINAIMNDGLIGNAKNAKDEWQKQTDAEQLELAKLEGMLAVETLPIVKAGGYTGTENKRYIDSEGNVAIIPAGFTVSNVKTDTVDETTISKGLVIYAGNQSTVTDMTTIQGTANQYVWIPVKNPSDIYGVLESPVEGIEGTKFGKLYDFGNYNGYATSASEATKYNWPEGTDVAYSKTLYREPTVLSRYDTDTQYYNTILKYKDVEAYKAGMVKEFNDMITSVEKYKGFYIGRYELTGNVSAPTVKRSLNPITSTSWYNLYNACINLESGNESAKDKVRTTMVWGCQWDQAIKMSLTDKNDFLTNAKAYGVYTDSEITTKGITGRMASAYNIYDMGGNVMDWTLEGSDINSKNGRTARGGGCSSHSNYRTPSMRDYDREPATIFTSETGCRAQLYIK